MELLALHSRGAERDNGVLSAQRRIASQGSAGTNSGIWSCPLGIIRPDSSLGAAFLPGALNANVRQTGRT
jgi:hypothetical protein